MILVLLRQGTTTVEWTTKSAYVGFFFLFVNLSLSMEEECLELHLVFVYFFD